MRHHLASLAAVGVIVLVVAGPAAPATSLVEEYAGVGDRPDAQPVLPSSDPVPAALPSAGRAATFPLRGPAAISVARDGSALVRESMTGRLLRLRRDGRVTVARSGRGYGEPVCAGTSARLWADRDGNQVLQVSGVDEPTPIAGTGRSGFSGDGGPATAARLRSPSCAVRAPDGGLLIADQGNARIRRVGPDGVITTIAGTGRRSFSGDGGPATEASFVPEEILPLPGGGLLVSAPDDHRVLRIGSDGVLTTVAGTGEPGFGGDGGPARSARLWMPWGLAREADGAILVTDLAAQTVRRITPDGRITTALGAPPTAVAHPSAAARATVPARRVVESWITSTPSGSRNGIRSTADETARGDRVLVRRWGFAGTLVEPVVVVDGRTYRWIDEQDVGSCWSRTDEGPFAPTGHSLLGRDLQALLGASQPYAPGPGPFAPDLAGDGHVLVRRIVATDSGPEFGVAAWRTRWEGLRIVEHLLDRRTGRVLTVQYWSAAEHLARRYDVRPGPRKPVALPALGPACPRWGTSVPFGFPAGMRLARRVTDRLARTRAVLVTATGRSNEGRPFRVRSVVGSAGGRVGWRTTEVAGPGRYDPLGEQGGSFVRVTSPSGVVRVRPSGSSCWIGSEEDAGSEARPVIVPVGGVFHEIPVRVGRLIRLRSEGQGFRVDTLVDPRTLMPVAQTWTSQQGHTGRAGLRPLRRLPRPPVTRPLCPPDEVTPVG